MNSSIDCLVRGSGKIFGLLRITDIPDGAAVTLSCVTDVGTPAPAMLLPFDGDDDSDLATSKRFVAVLAQLSIAQTLTLKTTSGDESSHRITPSTAKWLSRFHYRVNSALAERIRDYDYSHVPGRIALFTDESINDGATEILHGTANFDAAFTEPVTIALLDDRAEPLDDTTFVVMGDRIVIPEGQPELRFRYVSYSLRHPRHEAPLILEARTADGPLPGFVVIDQGQLDHLRDEGAYATFNAAGDPSYNEWFAAHKIEPDDVEVQRATPFPYEPLFSIVVPMYRTPIEYCCEMVESVVRQSYSHWELILVNASPEDEELSRTLADFAAMTDAIRVVELPSNEGISANTNAGVAVARGDYIALLDHDDVIEPNLLYEYARALNKDDAIDCLYCDEDKLVADGSRVQEPYFKPDFEIDLLRSVNYVCHMFMIRTSLFNALGGLNPAYDGAQDHDLVLRAYEAGARFYHARRLLYHWRLSADSTSTGIAAKTYAADAGLRAVRDHLNRLGIAATVRLYDFASYYEVIYEPPKPHPLVSIIIPSKDSIDYLDRCLTSIATMTTYDTYEIVIVENHSEDAATFEYYESIQSADAHVRVVTWEDDGAGFNFSKLVNFGAVQARGDYLLFLNNDVKVLTPDWLERLVGISAREDVGAVGVKLYYPDDTIQHAGVVMLKLIEPRHLMRNAPRDLPGYFGLTKLPRDLNCVTGACLMMRRDHFDEVGGFDERFAVDFNDVDLCLKVRAKGLLVVCTPDVELYHYESVSRGFNDSLKDALRFNTELALLGTRWIKQIGGTDPSYNIQLDGTEAYYGLGA